jgi:hypothetical protein
MPNVVGHLTELLARHAEAKAPASAAAANAFRTAGIALEAAASNAATTDAAWHAALLTWRGALNTLTQASSPGAPPLQLLLESVAARLPPVPGIDSVIGAIPSTVPLDRLQQWRDGLNGSVSLGPISLTALVPSVSARRPGDPVGDVIGLLPPSGLAIAVDCGFARGGGSLSFTDQPHWRLAGSFGLTLGPVSVSAFAVLERAGGALSLVLLMGARFTPGIQVGFGFALSGVGGLIGVNRRADTDALRARLASGAATDALFADDPSRNAPAILESLGAIFVPAAGSFVVGPTFQLSWLKLGDFAFFLLDIGVFIELPGPARIVIVGRAIAEVPGPGIALIHLQIDIVGELDFIRSLVHIRAALVNSHALGIFRAAGDAAFVLCWGDPPYVVLTIGGFYPGFNPAPAVLEPLRRIALSVDFDWLPGLSMRFEAYLAVTSNSFQLGGRLEVGINIGITAEGFVSLDALFQFRPFYFEVEIHGGLRVGVFGQTLAGVDVGGKIAGPGPIVLSAAISIEFFLLEFSWHDTFTIGEDGGDSVATIDLIPALKTELSPSNLHVRNGADPLVAVKPAPDTDVPLVSPVGALVFSQRVAPLNIRLERFGGIKLKMPTAARIAPTNPGVSAGAIERDHFAPGTFLDLTVAEALNQPPYDRLDSGFEVVFGAVRANGVKTSVVYLDYYRGRPTPIAGLLRHFDARVLSLAGGRRAEPAVSNRAPVVVARDEAWVTRDSTGAPTPAASRTAAHVAVRAGHASVALPASDAPISLAGVA